MIELPESKHLAGQFLERLVGKTVMNVTANKSPHKFSWFSGEPEAYHGKLCGKSILGADGFGGMAELQFGGENLVFCDGTNVRYFYPGEQLPLKHQLHIEFEDFSSIVCSVQMYGAMWLFEECTDEWYYINSKEKIKPLQKEFDPVYFDGLFKNTKQTLSVKAFLATEQRIPGLGNGVLQDILFNARIHPRRKLETITDAEKDSLYRSIKETLFEMTAKGGRDTEKDLFGCSGGYKTMLSAKTRDTSCPVCGDTIIRETYLGGNVYFCPTCQKIGKGGK